MAGEKSGITGTEFPTLNYLVYLLSLIFGFNDWYGRLINLIVSSLGVLYFYKLVKMKFSEKNAFISSIFLLASMWFRFSRKVMPDTFSTSLVIMSLFFVFSYLEEGKIKHLLMYLAFALLGLLSKIPSGYLLSLLIFVFAKDL